MSGQYTRVFQGEYNNQFEWFHKFLLEDLKYKFSCFIVLLINHYGFCSIENQDHEYNLTTREPEFIYRENSKEIERRIIKINKTKIYGI